MSRFEHLIGTELARGTWTWSSDDTLLYAVGVGAGQDDPTQELQFTTENTQGLAQRVLPSFMTQASTGGQLWMRPLGFKERVWEGISWGWPEGLVHGEHGVTLARPLPPQGVAEAALVLVGVYDKGSSAVVVTDMVVRLAATGELLGTGRASYFIRGQGGFGGPRGPADEQPWVEPGRDPDMSVALVTSPAQSLIFRLSGDRNPHCTDPARAREDGFERPIFQGLGTYGFGCRALLKGLCDGDVTRFGSMSARFSQPVFPGETLTTLIWRTDAGAQFRTLAPGGRVVLDRGTFGFAA
jgi:acyl dehydratase